MASAAIEAGHLIDQRFRVECLLGQGGFGAVYRCRDLRNESLVAVKLLRSFIKGKGASVLHSEFSILSRLRHPNLARIIDFGRIDGSGSLYIAQEYVEGKNLFAATADREVRQVVEILAELCRTVQFLHDHGVIHGDLKPGNLLIANQADTRVRLKVLDFGLAQWLTGEEKPPAARMLAYIAPEVLMGQKGGPQSDLYSLGILFYEVLARRLPFEDEDPGYLIQKHLQGQADLHPMESLEHGAGLARVIAQLLDKDPKRRPRSAEELIGLLGAASGHDLGKSETPGDRLQFSSGILVGREKELETLRQRARQVRDSKRGWTVFILGEEGSGKSRCMEELKIWAQLEGWRVVQGRCTPNERRLHGPYREILSSTGSGRQDRWGGTHEPHRTKESAPAGSAISAGLVGDTSPTQFLDYMVGEIVERLANRPSLVLLHDFQWSDEATTAVLDYLLFDVLAHPIFLCISTLEGDVEQRPVDRLISQTTRQLRGEKLTLAPLGEDAITQLIVSLTGEVQHGQRLGEWVSRHVGGNPLFIEQMLEHLVERGILTRESGRWNITESDLDNIKAPKSVSSIIQQRLSRLSSNSRELADWLGVINRPVSPGFLESVVAARPQELRSSLEELVNRQIARTFEGSEGQTYGFSHISFADIVIEDLLPSRKRDMHLSVGLALEKQGSGMNLVEIATHLVDAHGGEKAVDYALRAEAICKSEFSNEMTLRFARFILDNGAHLPIAQLCEIAVDAADASSAVGAPEDGVSILKQRLQASGRAPRIVRARLLMQLAHCYQHLGRLELLDETCRNALDLLGKDHSELADVTRAVVNRHLAYPTTVKYQHRQGLGFLNKALEDLGRHGLVESVLGGRIYILIAVAHWTDSNYRASVVAARKAVKIFENTRSFASRSQAHSILGMGMASLGKFGLAREQEEKAVAVAGRSRSSTTKLVALANLVESVYRSGHVRDASSLADQVLEIMTEVRNPVLLHEGYAIIAEARVTIGDYAGAKEILDRLRSYPESDIPVHSRGQVIFLNAWLDHCLGNNDSALIRLDELERLHREKGPVSEYERGEAIRAAILYSRGQKAEARELLLGLDSVLRLRGRPYQSCIVNLRLAEILLEDGELDRARRSIGCALKLSGAMPSRHLDALVHMLRARFHRLQSERSTEGIEDTERTASLVEARAEIDAALRLANEAGVEDIMWQAHAEGARIEERISNWRAAADHSAKVVESLDRARKKVTTQDVPGFLAGLGRGAAREECASRIVQIRVIQARESLRSPVLADAHSTLLQRLTHVISSIRNRDALIESLIDLMVQAAGMERALIFLREKGSDRLRMAKGRTAMQETVKRADAASRSVINEVYRRGEPFITANARMDPRLSTPDSVATSEIGTLFCGPLRQAGRILGVLYADHPSPLAEISESMISLFAACCDLAAAAIASSEPTAQAPVAIDAAPHESQEESGVAYPEIIGRSETIQQLRLRISSVAASPLDVLIMGESGTGKELVARAVHRASVRSKGKFVAVDCGSLADSLVESEFFGYRKGAFTGAAEDRAGLVESADGGTLFLDEISNLSHQLQGKLLRVLQEREVRRIGDLVARKIDLRVIAATNRNLSDEVARGGFRQDLYYRLNGMGITVPPLRERLEDVALLLDHFLNQSAQKTGGQAKAFSPRALELLKRCRYPGNVRELMNIVGNGYYTAPGNVIDAEHLPVEVRQAHVAQLLGKPDDEHAREIYQAIRADKGRFEDLLKAPFKEHRVSREVILGVIRHALTESRGRYKEALGLLGVEEKDYHGTMTFLKRHDCCPDFRPFRGAKTDPQVS